MNRIQFKIFVFSLLLFHALSHYVTNLKYYDNHRGRRGSKPQIQSEPDQDPITIAIIGTNDIHGTVFPREILRTDTEEIYKYGGLVYMANLMETINAEFGKRAIYLDGGDQFQGGIEAGPQVSKG